MKVNGKMIKFMVIVIYEVADEKPLGDNGRYLSIDLGLHNLMTCYDNCGKSFILGRKYLSVMQRYDKEIARVQSQWSTNVGIYISKSIMIMGLHGAS